MLMLKEMQKHNAFAFFSKDDIVKAYLQHNVQNHYQVPVVLKAFSVEVAAKDIAFAMLNLYHFDHVEWYKHMEKLVMLVFKFCNRTKRKNVVYTKSPHLTNVPKDENYHVYVQAGAAVMGFIRHIRDNYRIVVRDAERNGITMNQMTKKWEEWMPKDNAFAQMFLNSKSSNMKRKMTILKHFIWRILVDKVTLRGEQFGASAFTNTQFIALVPRENVSSDA